MKEIDYWLEDTDDESKLPPYDEEVIALWHPEPKLPKKYVIY